MSKEVELWDLLDENGNKIGRTHIRGEKYPMGLYHLGVDIWIRNSKGEFLVQKRSENKESHPGVWAMTGGSALSGETSIEAIHRETLEELGIDIDISKLKLLNTLKTNKAFIDTYLYEIDIDIKDLKLQKEEVDEALWLSSEQIDDMVKRGEFIESRWINVRNLFI